MAWPTNNLLARFGFRLSVSVLGRVPASLLRSNDSNDSNDWNWTSTPTPLHLPLPWPWVAACLPVGFPQLHSVLVIMRLILFETWTELDKDCYLPTSVSTDQ